jgi:hypothetical protein
LIANAIGAVKNMLRVHCPLCVSSEAFVFFAHFVISEDKNKLKSSPLRE